MPNIFSLKNKVIAISGANGYLGHNISQFLLSQGAFLARFDTMSENSQIPDVHSPNMHNFIVDVTNEEEISTLAAKVFNTFGRLDGLINCAGINKNNSMFEYTFSDFTAILKVNVAGSFICCKHFGAYMKEQHFGSIINLASLGGYVASFPPNFKSAYNTSKGAILHMTRALAAELAPYGIRCNSISPGIMEQSMSNIKNLSSSNINSKQKIIELTPMQRRVKAKELFGAVAYLLSDSSSATTGIDILIDCGYHLW